MACFHPLEAWQLESGEVVFAERGSVRRKLSLPCGRCIGCRLVRSRSWAIRCMHEAQTHRVSAFVTLTYSDEFFRPSLYYPDFQRFMYRLRRRLGPRRFFVCGEYGERTLRPHFHALLFGCEFGDRSPVGRGLFQSRTLNELWPFGFASVGDVTYQSAAYCARYCQKKVTGPRAEAHYERVDVRTGEVVRVEPEFGHMSLKPGLGYLWFQRYWKEVYLARDGVVLAGGKVSPAPRYYDRLLAEMDGELRDWKDYERYVNSARFLEDCSPERLLVRERCTLARLRFNQRGGL